MSEQRGFCCRPNPVAEQLVDDDALHEGNRVRNPSGDDEGTPSANSGLTAIEWTVEAKDPSDAAAAALGNI